MEKPNKETLEKFGAGWMALLGEDVYAAAVVDNGYKRHQSG